VGRGISAGTMGVVLLAILAGLVGAYLIRASLIREPEIVEEPPVSVVPLAAVDLPPGRTIALGDVALTQMKPEELAERGWPTDKVMMAPEQIIGRVLREELKQGKPFLTDILYLEGTRPDFTKDLKPGYRAISMPLSKDRGGSLPMGTIVDVMFRAQERKPAPGQLGIPEVTVRLLEGVKIIDVYEPPAQNTRGPYTAAGLDLTRLNVSRTPPPPTVTLAVTPEQAEILQTTTGRGELTLVARPPEERLVSAGRRKGLTLEEVLGIEPPKPPPPVILFATEIYRRGARSVNIYRDDKLVEQIRAEQNQQQQQPADAAVPPPGPQPPVPADVAPMGAVVPAPVEGAPAVVPAPAAPAAPAAEVPAAPAPAPAVTPAAPPATPMP